jgi:hypothetical protein
MLDRVGQRKSNPQGKVAVAFRHIGGVQWEAFRPLDGPGAGVHQLRIEESVIAILRKLRLCTVVDAELFKLCPLRIARVEAP